MAFRLSAEAWRERVRKFNTSGLPEDFLIAWIDHESGGNAASLGAATEVGIFQIDMQDGPRFGGSVETLHTNFAPYGKQTATRALTEAEKDLQVTTGLAMVRAYVERARSHANSVGADWPEGSSDFWKLVKWQHALPAYSLPLLQLYKTKNGRAPDTFDGWASWVNVQERPSFVSTRYWNTGGTGLEKYFKNAQKVGAYGGGERLLGSWLPLVVIALVLYFMH
jgi:hypothetical protein